MNSLTGEPDAKQIGQKRAGLQRVDEGKAIWPNLASVPPRPTGMPPHAVRQQQNAELIRDREEALQILQAAGQQPKTP